MVVAKSLFKLNGKLMLHLFVSVDATAKIDSETRRECGRKIRMSEDIIDEVTEKWQSYGLPGTGKPIWK